MFFHNCIDNWSENLYLWIHLSQNYFEILCLSILILVWHILIKDNFIFVINHNTDFVVVIVTITMLILWPVLILFMLERVLQHLLGALLFSWFLLIGCFAFVCIWNSPYLDVSIILTFKLLIIVLFKIYLVIFMFSCVWSLKVVL